MELQMKDRDFSDESIERHNKVMEKIAKLKSQH